jgi:hypothetical protein
MPNREETRADAGGAGDEGEELTTVLDAVFPGISEGVASGMKRAVRRETDFFLRWVLAPARGGGNRTVRKAATVAAPLMLVVVLACTLPPVGTLVVRGIWGGPIDLSPGTAVWLDGIRLCLEILAVLCVGGGAYSQVVRRMVRERLESFEAELKTRIREDSEQLERRTLDSCNRIVDVLGRAGQQPVTLTLRDLLGESDRFGRGVLAQVPRHYDLFLMNQAARAFPGGILGLTAFMLYLGVIGLKVFKLWAALPVV